ncbi:GNAT family N-acetyltransferase [Kitasatospora purpeofusca]|uniref:GNAT family N-acetyltransferase n=1 Tax=Kitasatospora purpeofusca TaxID=67352 RepID=UPI0004C06D5E|nr:GNAT family protein [Kitasatospora purpeofusca]
MPYPVHLTGSRVALREFRADDVADALLIVGDDQVTRWLSFDSRTPEQTRAMLDGAVERARLEPRDEYYLAVTPLEDEQRVVGFVRIGLAGVKAGKLGYAVAAGHWGLGYATDAARAIIRLGFEELGLHRVSAAIGPDNAASIAVVERLGFSREGVLRDHVFTNNAWRDSVLYSLLADEWSAQAQRCTAKRS